MKIMNRHLRSLSRGMLAAGVLTACVPLAALGQVPNAGSLQQQVQPPAPATPAPAVPRVTIEQSERAPMPATAAFEVRVIRITGNTAFETPVLHALVADGEGKSLTLPQLDELAGRITDYYNRHGYPLARAIVPAQVIRDGLVTIDIIEARYGKVRVENRSLAGDRVLQSTLAPLQAGDAIEQSRMDSALLLLSDIPGVQPSAVFRPGERTGTSDLTVSADPAPPVTGTIVLDNFGNRFTGRARASAGLGCANPLRFGDLLTLNVISSGSRLNYARAGYESVLNGHGTRLGGAYSALTYKLGEEFEPLLSHGSSRNASVWLR